MKPGSIFRRATCAGGRITWATVAEADENVWLKNLRQSGAGYLVVGKGGVLGLPPEAGFVAGDAKHFRKLFEGAAGTVYAISFELKCRASG